MRALLMIVLALLLALPAAAQTGADYAVDTIRPPELSPDGAAVIIAFDVRNLGSSANRSATARAISEVTGEELASLPLTPLISGESVTMILTVPLESLPAQGSQRLLITVGIDEVESSSAPTIANNTAEITIPPLDELRPAAQPTAPTPQTGLDAILRRFGFNPNDPVHVVALAGICLVSLVFLVLLIIVLRLLFREKPRFVLHAPPYASVPQMAPSTNAGRRQGWQFHAQSDQAPPYPANEGSTHVRKLLIGMDGLKLSNWEITGIRMNQYDQYGRIARSEVIAPRKLCRSLSKTAARAPSLSEEQVSRRMRPIAARLVGQFRRKINNRSAMLPIALDIAFQGVHGEVRIRFELFYLEQGRWRMVDAWEPEMTVTGRAIYENYAYSLNGLRQGEPLNTFSRRLQDDLTNVLTDMLKQEPTHDTGSSRPVDAMRG
jgi:hypothetical protein